jgi:hypothetical protein
MHKIIFNVSLAFSSWSSKLPHSKWFSHQNSAGLYISSFSVTVAGPSLLVITTLEVICDLYKSPSFHKREKLPSPKLITAAVVRRCTCLGTVHPSETA